MPNATSAWCRRPASSPDREKSGSEPYSQYSLSLNLCFRADSRHSGCRLKVPTEANGEGDIMFGRMAVFLGFLVVTHTACAQDREKLLGIWKLVSFETEYQ